MLSANEHRVAPLDDPAAIDRILRDPWIASKIRHDAREPGYIEHPLLTYFGAWLDGDLVGCFAHVRFSTWEVEVHAALLRSATLHAREIGATFLDLVFADPQVMRATAHVMASLPSAANYCRRLGFRDEGVRRNACLQNSRPVDVLMLGLLRQEWTGATSVLHRRRHWIGTRGHHRDEAGRQGRAEGRGDASQVL